MSVDYAVALVVGVRFEGPDLYAHLFGHLEDEESQEYLEEMVLADYITIKNAYQEQYDQPIFIGLVAATIDPSEMADVEIILPEGIMPLTEACADLRAALTRFRDEAQQELAPVAQSLSWLLDQLTLDRFRYYLIPTVS